MLQRRSLLLLHTLFLISFSPPAKALKMVNIDDEDGDPITGAKITYSPDGVWSYGPTCFYCSAKPDANQVYEGSWHDGWYTPNNPPLVVQVLFTGTAVNVVGILSHGSSGAASDLTFYIDGVQKYHYSQSDIDGNGFVYNYSFFSTSSLEFMQHNLTIVNGGNLGQSTSLLLLDYIEYSYDETPSSSNQASSTSIVDKAGSLLSTTPSGSTTTRSASSSSTTTDSRSLTSSLNITAYSGMNATQPTSTRFSNESFASSVNDGVSSQSASPAHTNTSTSSPASLSKSNLGLIIGSTLGALTFLSVLILSLILTLRTCRQGNESRRGILLPSPLSESAPLNSVPQLHGRAEKASVPCSSNSQTDSNRDGDVSLSQGSSQTNRSDARSRMISDVFTLAAEVQRLVGEISRDGHGNADGGSEGTGEDAAEGASLPPPYS